MDILLEDYKRKLVQINEMIESQDRKGLNSIRLNTKASCYRSMITDIERAQGRAIINKQES